MGKIKKIYAVYSIVSSICIIFIWTFFFSTGFAKINFSNFEESQLFLLIAESTTSLLLLISGIGVLIKKLWAEKLINISYGMLLYAIIIGLGQFLQKKNLFLILLFFSIILATVIMIIFNIFNKKNKI